MDSVEQKPLVILGIDPGYGLVGYGLLAVAGNRFAHIAHGAITTTKKKPLAFRLNEIYVELGNIISKYKPEEVSIESLFFYRNVTTAMAVSEARGVIQLIMEQSNIKIFEYTPFQIKQAVTGNGRAEKGQMQRALKLFLGLESTPKPDDAADALGAAVCHANSRRFNARR